MILSIVLAVLASVLGIPVGRALSRRGVTAANALTGRQGLAYTVFLGAGAITAFLYVPALRNRLPAGFTIRAESLAHPITLLAAGAAVGFILALEWPGRNDARRRRTALLGSGVLLLAIGYLASLSRPVDSVIREPFVEDGVVYQTTAFTCAPASIATLMRATGLDSASTERDVAVLTRTTRRGTTTAGELRAMERLGLDPRFGRGLTVDSLLAHGGPALLHVSEPIEGGRRIRHAVALVDFDTAAGTVTLANPLRGRQVVPFASLDGYWIGEAILVTAPGLRRPGRD